MKSRNVLINGIIGVTFLLLSSLSGTGQANGSPATIEGAVVRMGTSIPVEKVVVTLKPEIAAPGSSPYTSLTGKAGDFSIAGLPAGRYTASLSRNGFIMPRTAGPVVFDVAPGQNLKGLELEIVEAGAIAGHILDENGNPRIKVRVHAVQPEYVRGRRIFSPCSTPAKMPNASVETDENGEFRLFGLEPGEYLLASLGQNCEAVPQYFPGVIDPADAAGVTVGPGGEATVNFRLKTLETHSVRFKVVLDGLTAQARPEDVIMLRGRSGDALEIFTSFQKSGDGTSFLTPRLPSGTYDIYHSPNLGWGSIGHLTVTIGDRDVDGGSMTIHAGAPISGQLHDAGNSLMNSPLQKARVYLRAMDMIDGPFAGMSPIFDDIKKDGKFVLTEVPERSYRVEVTRLPSDMYVASALYKGMNVLDSGLSLEGGAGGPLDITIDVGGSVAGTIRNAKGDPIANGQIVLIPSKSHRGNFTLFKTAISDTQGAFILTGVAPGDYGVLAFADVPPGACVNEEYLREFEGKATLITVQRNVRTTMSSSLGLISRSETANAH